MNVELAKTAGFCFGVKRAVDTVYQQIEQYRGEKIFTYGPIIHNEEVIKDLRSHGVEVLNDEEELKTADADVKVYLTASVETRAKRRYQELQEKGEDCNLEEIAHDIEERDRRDMTREIAPLKQAEDAVLVDSSDMTIAEVVKTIVDLCR